MRTKTTCLLLALAAAWAFADEDPATREHQFYRTYGPSPLFKDNSFVGETVEDKALPDAEAWKTRVPRAVWDGHPREVAAIRDCRRKPLSSFDDVYVEAHNLEDDLMIRRVDPAHGVEARFGIHMAMDKTFFHF